MLQPKIRRQKIMLMTVILLLITIQSPALYGQSRLSKMPGYERYTEMQPKLTAAFADVRNGWKFIEWNKDSKGFKSTLKGITYNYSVKDNSNTEILRDTANKKPVTTSASNDFTKVVSPDKKHIAIYRKRNLWLSDSTGQQELPITIDGNDKGRIKYGTTSSPYEGSINGPEAIWWSPDSKKIAFYRFDESMVKDYYLPKEQVKLQDTIHTEAYTMVGEKNPVVDIFIYDLESGKTIKVDVSSAYPAPVKVIWEYFYSIEWTPDGSELLFHRTNRKQDIMEFVAANRETGKTRVVIHEEWPASYTTNNPSYRFLGDGRRIIWTSERNGYLNYYLYDLSGKLLSTITQHSFEVMGAYNSEFQSTSDWLRIDEKNNKLYYMARSGDNHMKRQLHKVGLDGQNDTRLTDPALDHIVYISPDFNYFVDIAQTHDKAPVSSLMDMKGKELALLSRADLTKFNDLGVKKNELFTFKAADGITDLHGMISFPTNFDSTKKYPVLVSVYNAPSSQSINETFYFINESEFGFLYVKFESRGAGKRGKAFKDLLYGNLGIVEIDDQAEGVKYIGHRSYVNKEKIGIFGISYGGMVAATCILRFPDLFQAACSSSGLMNLRNYDNIYMERYQGLLETNKSKYDTGSAISYAKNLKGHLMIYYGTADNNVHPSNSLQLIDALQKARKSFEVQVGVDAGHTWISFFRMMEFFIERLVMNK